MVTELIHSSITTCVIFLVNAVFKTKQKLSFYALIFALSFFISQIFCSQVQAEVPPKHLSYIRKGMPIAKSLTYTQRQEYTEKRDMHKANAERTWQNIQNHYFFLPNMDDRELAKRLFSIAMSSTGAKTPTSKLLVMLTLSLTEYGLACIDEWNYIDQQMYWCEYHWEMYEFYCDVLIKA